MNWFYTQTEGLSSPACILHLGAGSCYELEVYQAKNPQHIFLVEPNPEFITLLQQKTSSMSNVTIVDSAISSSPDNNRLNILSDPCYSSLSQPSRLYDLMPSLMKINKIQVKTHSIVELLADLSIDFMENNWLVVETPGVELEVINSLEKINQLKRFTHIFLRAGREAYYEGAATAEEILEKLVFLGYRKVVCLDNDDSDLPLYHLKYDEFFAKFEAECVENRMLQEELKKVRVEIKKLDVQSKVNMKEQLGLKEGIKKLRCENKELSEKSNALKGEKAVLREEIKNVKSEKKALFTKSESLKKKNTDINDQLRDLKLSNKTILEKNVELVALKLELRKSKDSLKESLRHNSDLDCRQVSLDNEVVKVEAQLELIKQLVFREKKI